MLKLFTQNQEYKEGRMLTGEVKQRLIVVLSELVARHQRARAQVTEEVMNFFHLLTVVPVVVHTYYQVFSIGQNVFYQYK